MEKRLIQMNYDGEPKRFAVVDTITEKEAKNNYPEQYKKFFINEDK